MGAGVRTSIAAYGTRVPPVQWGVQLPHFGRQASRDNLVGFAQRIDELGYHSGWTSDHIAWPRSIESQYPYTDDGHFPANNDMPWLDAIGTLLFVAGCTEHIELGITVLVLGYRPPVQTAKLLSTLDVVSNGRLILGVGVGWMREEFEALGMPYDHRGPRADEQLDIFSRLFNDDNPSYDGRFYKFEPIGFAPKPVRSVPVWVGGATEPAYQRVATRGTGFHAAFEPIDALAAGWRRILEICKENGRNPDELTFSVRWYLDRDAQMDPKKSLQGSAQQMIDAAKRLADIGVSHMLLDPVTRGGMEGRISTLEWFASEVMTAI